jgi:hypothetical protein
MRYGLVFVPDKFPFMPSTVPDAETLHVPTDAQISVTPLLFEKLVKLDHE